MGVNPLVFWQMSKKDEAVPRSCEALCVMLRLFVKGTSRS